MFLRSEYAKKDFWNERFEKFIKTKPLDILIIRHKGFFDWYIEYNEFKLYLE